MLSYLKQCALYEALDHFHGLQTSSLRVYTVSGNNQFVIHERICTTDNNYNLMIIYKTRT